MNELLMFGFEPREFDGSFGGGSTAERCRVCRGDIWRGEVFGRDGCGRAICIDCARREFNSLTPTEQLTLLGYDAEYTSATPRRRAHLRQ